MASLSFGQRIVLQDAQQILGAECPWQTLAPVMIDR
jgi:hypothetical protein